MKWLGYKSNNVNIVRLFLYTNLLKYIPGGVWHFLERLRILKVEIGGGKSLSAVFLEPFLMLAAALAFVSFGLPNKFFSFICFLPSLLFITRFREPLLKRLEHIKANEINKMQREVFKLKAPNYKTKDFLTHFRNQVFLGGIIWIGLILGTMN